MLMKKKLRFFIFVLFVISFLPSLQMPSNSVKSEPKERVGIDTSHMEAMNTDNWQMFHHDSSRTGYSTSRAPNTNEIIWTYTTGDYVDSSPAVVDGTVFIGSGDYKIYALKADTGEHIWNYTTEGPVRSSPAVANGKVFVGSNDGKVYALNSTTGVPVWNYSIGTAVWYSSPAVSDGKVFIASTDHKIYALNETDGSLIWTYTTGDTILSSPAVVDDRVFIGSGDYKIYALEADTGEHIWNYTTEGRVDSCPSVANGKVFAASASRKVYALNQTTGTLVWNYTTEGYIGRSSPAIAYGMVFIGTSTGLLALNESTGARLWTASPLTLDSSPAVADGKVFIGSEGMLGKLHAVNVSTGEVKWSYSTLWGIVSSPAIYNGTLVVGSEIGKVYAFRSNKCPEARNLTITPSLPITTDDLVGSYEYYDPDGDPESGTEIRWYKDDDLQPAYNNTLTVPSSATSKGEVWYFTVKPRDGLDFGALQTSPSVTIGNSPPSASNLTVTPPIPVTTDDLIGSYDYFDIDNDLELGSEIRWYKNNYLQPAYNETLTVPSSATSKGEVWYFTVKPKDGIDFGTTQTSPSRIIRNSAPSITSVDVTPDPAYTTSTLTATPSGWFDADEDPEGYAYQWQRFESGSWQNISGATAQTLEPGNFFKGDQIKVVCTPYDGEGYGVSREDTIIISNSPPTIDSHYPLIDPIIEEGESQEFNITKSDADLDPLAVVWYLNGTKVKESSDSYTIVASPGSIGIYNITVTVSDDSSQARHEWTLTITPVMTHDVAITSVNRSKTIVCQGYSMFFDVVIENQGDVTETFNVTIYANTTTIETLEITLNSANCTVISFTWNTAGVVKGNYTMRAYAWPVLREKDLADNTLTDGWVIVALVGDINADGIVDITDIYLIALAFGAMPSDPRYNPNLDIVYDGIVDISDIYTAAIHYGEMNP